MSELNVLVKTLLATLKVQLDCVLVIDDDLLFRQIGTLLFRLLLVGSFVETEVRCVYRIIFYGLYHHRKQRLSS